MHLPSTVPYSIKRLNMNKKEVKTGKIYSHSQQFYVKISSVICHIFNQNDEN